MFHVLLQYIFCILHYVSILSLSSYIRSPLSLSCSPSTLLLWQPPYCCLCLQGFCLLVCCFLFHIPHNSEIIWFLFFFPSDFFTQHHILKIPHIFISNITMKYCNQKFAEALSQNLWFSRFGMGTEQEMTSSEGILMIMVQEPHCENTYKQIFNLLCTIKRRIN